MNIEELEFYERKYSKEKLKDTIECLLGHVRESLKKFHGAEVLILLEGFLKGAPAP